MPPPDARSSADTQLDALDPVALTKALIRCPSITPEEGGALSLLERLLTHAGFSCHRVTFSEPGTPDVENLYARIGTSSPHLVFAGHTDVVPPGDLARWTSDPFGAHERDGQIIGRGAVDMKGAIACFVAAAMGHLGGRDLPARGSISFLITGDEEGPSINGTVKLVEWLSQRGETIDACLVGEPSNPERLGDEIKIGRRGSVTCDLVIQGKQGHAAYPQKADNPVPKLARFIDRLMATPIDEGTADFERSNCQVTVISVPNTAANVIPGEARATFNIRYNDLWRRPSIEEWVRLQCEAAAAATGATYSLSFAGTGDVFLTRAGPLVDTLSAAIMKETGVTPRLTTGGGTSDARFIKDICPVVEFGLVNETIHQTDERVAIDDLFALTRIYRRFIDSYLGPS
ncbi:MAG: succinyl-diaminopimelate desuccinylase [Hyphomicrobium sp.]|nr:succinyl-diaminopimelate desuccinylase [Hyphomicrobium sp.]